MDLVQIQLALEQAKKISNHTEFVIIGSLSVLGCSGIKPPTEMSMSIDIDFYPLNDPGRASQIADVLGQGSDFDIRNGFYLDAVSPKLPTLPDGWEARMPIVELGELKVSFLDVNDAAISKYARGQVHDMRWIEAGYEANILDPEVIEARLRFTEFFDYAEKQATIVRFESHMATIDENHQFNRPLLDFLKHNQPIKINDVDIDAGIYHGSIVWVDDKKVVQNLGKDHIAIHHTENLSNKPILDEKTRITYDNGRAIVEPYQHGNNLTR